MRGDGLEQPTPLSPAYPPQHDLETSEGGYNSVQRARQLNPYESPLNPPDQQYQPTSTYVPATPSSPGHMNQTFQQGPIHPMRKNVSGQIPNLSNHLNAQVMAGQDVDPSSPGGMNGNSLPTSPIAAIIDQDAEKYRVYMSKLTNPNRRGPPGANGVTGDNQDHAMALGQAVAMENIQAQIEIQNQLRSQSQNQSQQQSQSQGIFKKILISAHCSHALKSRHSAC